jgi:hypothetical protein
LLTHLAYLGDVRQDLALRPLIQMELPHAGRFSRGRGHLLQINVGMRHRGHLAPAPQGLQRWYLILVAARPGVDATEN